MNNYRENTGRRDIYRSENAYGPQGSGKNLNTDAPQNPNRYRQNRSGESDLDHGRSRDADERNIRVGRDLHNRYDKNEHSRYGHRQEDRRHDEGRHQPQDRKWDEGTFFHTGPASRGSEQYRREHQGDHNRDRGNLSDHYRNQDRQLQSFNDQHQRHHYGSRPDSVYRRNDNLNYGDHHQAQYGQQRSASRAGSGYEANRQPLGLDHNPHTEGPGTGSRYKEDDYRYGSGNHNFYQEGRYQRGGGIGDGFEGNKGFFERVGDGIRDAWESVTNDDRDNVSGSEGYRSRDHEGRDRRFDRGYESGPRWADESRAQSKRGDYPTGWRNNEAESRDTWGDQNRRREDRW